MFSSMRIVLAVLIGCSTCGAVQPNALFTNNAVLQQGLDIPVWGTARDGEHVTVELAGQKISTIAADGKWMVRLKPLSAAGPLVMKIIGDNTVELTNLMVGEVWVCGGQSNMERQLGPRPPQPLIENWEREAAEANDPQIRCFTVEHRSSGTPLAEVKGTWEVCSPQAVKNFTAVGYFFGRDLHQAIKVPVGLIHSSVGGTPAELWISREGLESDPELRGLAGARDKDILAYKDKLEQFKKDEPALLEAYNTAVAEATKAKKPLPRKPSPPADPSNGGPSLLYNAMIAPLQPYAIRGVIWYQGEANNGRAKQYQTLFPAMIANWRRGWGGDAFPFLFVQIAPFNGMGPDIREAQLLTLGKSPNTAMVVTVDCGDANNIHPARKQPVGARLALAARALAYGEKIEYSGPIFQSMKIEGNRAVLTFTHADGLVAKGGELKGFTIAGLDQKFVPAKAAIEGAAVVVFSDDVAKPAAVRYGWANVPDVNLFNQQDLPASPFRTAE